MGHKYTYEIGKVYDIRRLLRIFRDEKNQEMAESECIFCKNTKVEKAYELYNEKLNSCMCQNKTHGLSKTKLYGVYANMKYRCYNPNANEYKNYGGKGIRVCDDWLNDDGFVKFYVWAINNGYQEGLSIDRINENGNYEPSNCQWLSISENTAKANKTCQHRKANKGDYYGIFPDGKRYVFSNANQFAKEHDLLANCARQVANKLKKTHKGWKFGFVSEEL